jgi:Arc/MetJ-type ribon-helix-helix transcriptional regulator
MRLARVRFTIRRMMIVVAVHLPNDVESSITAEVLRGHFPSVDDAVAEIVREYFLRRPHQAEVTAPAVVQPAADPLLGSMSDHAELMDEIVEDAMRHREHQPWRLSASE